MPILFFLLPDELLPEVAVPAVADAVKDEAEAGKAAAPDVGIFFISELLLEPADMSLAGPVAEVRDIFSSSNSTEPIFLKEKRNQFML